MHDSVLDAVLTIHPNWSTLFTGESVTFRCYVKEGEDTDWEYKISKDCQGYKTYRTDKQLTLSQLITDHSGVYQCCARRKGSVEIKYSNNVSLTVSGESLRFIILAKFTCKSYSVNIF